MDKSIKRKLKGLKAFSIFDLVLLAMLTAASVGFKVVAGNLVRMITGPLGIPGGALAGGLYMLWLPLSIVLVGKRGSALLISAVQTIVMVTTGAPGSHGVWTALTYMVPALFVELVFLYRPRDGYNILHFMLSTILANMAGTFGSNLLFFRLSIYPLLFTLLAASLSGALGGVVAYLVYAAIVKTGILSRVKIKVAIKKKDDNNISWEEIDKQELTQVNDNNIESDKHKLNPMDDNNLIGDEMTKLESDNTNVVSHEKEN